MDLVDSGGGIGDDGLTGFVFTNNVVRNNDGAIALRGAPLSAAVPTTSTVVSGNSFTNMNTNLWAGPCSYPSNQCGWAGVEVTRVTTATVTNNTFDNLQLGSFNEGEGLQAWLISTLTVTGNTFNNCDSGIEIANQTANITLFCHRCERNASTRSRARATCTCSTTASSASTTWTSSGPSCSFWR